MPVKNRDRLMADRFRRVWAVAELIAAEPGLTRGQLSDRFHLSERQIQGDLNIIRVDMRLPLIRRQGYRFGTDGYGGGASSVSLGQAQLLVLLVAKSMRDKTVSTARVRALLSEIPSLCPPHLAPIVGRLAEAVTSRTPSQQQRSLVLLTEAMLADIWVTLGYALGCAPGSGVDPTIKPTLLLPYLDDWYVLGPCLQNKGAARMAPLDGVQTVTPTTVNLNAMPRLARAS
ncbi:MAG: hypothetical protein IT306_14640 [Chloroflexi bacterium]|nr:hypothetical protein [Chloroflexota bacterium]